jgi:hypothetical protein
MFISKYYQYQSSVGYRVKLPDDIKQAITKELHDELMQDLIDNPIYHCHQCSAPMNEPAWTCSAVCLELDLEKRQSKICKY